MDFLSTARLLMRLREDHPNLRYEFVDGQVVMMLPVEDTVPQLFEDAERMFEPA